MTPPAGRALVIANFVLFQAAWFACVLGAAHGHAAWGSAAALAVVAWHLAVARRWQPEARLIGAAVGIGLVLETLLVQAGWVRHVDGVWLAGLPPHWIVALWALFATTLNVSLRWLQGRPWLAAALGAVAAPLSYAGGVRLGAAQFADPGAALAALAVGWALAMPLLVRLSERWDGIGAVAPAPGLASNPVAAPLAPHHHG